MILKMHVDFSAPVRVILTPSAESQENEAVFSGAALAELVLKNVKPEAAKDLVQGEDYILEFKPCKAISVSSAPEQDPPSGQDAPPGGAGSDGSGTQTE